MDPEDVTRDEMIEAANAKRKDVAITVNRLLVDKALQIHQDLVELGKDDALQVLQLAAAMLYPVYLD